MHNEDDVRRSVLAELQLMRLALQDMQVKVDYWTGHPALRRIVGEDAVLAGGKRKLTAVEGLPRCPHGSDVRNEEWDQCAD
jgi:hypothetical protein